MHVFDSASRAMWVGFVPCVSAKREFECFCHLIADELDAIGTKRFDSELSGDREVQRTMLELLNQLDGFSSDDRIKVGLILPLLIRN